MAEEGEEERNLPFIREQRNDIRWPSLFKSQRIQGYIFCYGELIIPKWVSFERLTESVSLGLYECRFRLCLKFIHLIRVLVINVIP